MQEKRTAPDVNKDELYATLVARLAEIRAQKPEGYEESAPAADGEGEGDEAAEGEGEEAAEEAEEAEEPEEAEAEGEEAEEGKQTGESDSMPEYEPNTVQFMCDPCTCRTPGVR